VTELHDLAIGFALDALDELDRARFERHLADCADCQATVRQTSETAATLAMELAEEPPSELRQRVLEEISTLPQEAPARKSSRWRGVAAWAAAVAVFAVGGWWLSQTESRAIDRILSDPDAVAVAAVLTPEAEGTLGEAEVVVSPESQAGVLQVVGLAVAPDDRVYQMWLIDEGGPEPAGVFRPETDGTATVLIDGEVSAGITVALTNEPAGGSLLPTGEVLMTAGV
jgi:anti-sigma-K factor RskA